MVYYFNLLATTLMLYNDLASVNTYYSHYSQY